MTRLFRLSVVTVIATYALIVLGGITRVSGSGLGCEDDWPLCQGHPYPPLDTLAIIEYLHRTVASLIGLLVLVMSVLIWRSPKTSRQTRYLVAFAFGLIIVQGLLGAVTVWRELPSSIVTAHLATSMMFLASTMLIVWFLAIDRGAPRWRVEAGWQRRFAPVRRFGYVAAAGALIVFVIILSGGATSSSGAALACDEWPRCISGQFVPEHTSRYTWINITHRTLSALGALAVVAVFLQAVRGDVPLLMKRLSTIALVIALVQVGFGAAYVLTDGSSWMSALHLATATLLWAVLLTLAWFAREAAVVSEAGSTVSDSGPVRSGVAPGTGSASL